MFYSWPIASNAGSMVCLPRCPIVRQPDFDTSDTCVYSLFVLSCHSQKEAIIGMLKAITLRWKHLQTSNSFDLAPLSMQATTAHATLGTQARPAPSEHPNLAEIARKPLHFSGRSEPQGPNFSLQHLPELSHEQLKLQAQF